MSISLFFKIKKMEHKQNNSTADHDHDLSNNNGHEGNEDHKHSGHDHMGHMEHMGNLKHKFWISLIITFPILLLSSFMGIDLPFQFTKKKND